MSESLVTSVLRWLRAGYPDGVPPKDYTPLLALLRRTLSRAEFGDVLVALEQTDGDAVRLRHIRDAISQVTDTAPEEDDVRRVAARLAAAGWPLSNGALKAARTVGEHPEEPADEPGGIVYAVLRWLRAGYPEGVPASDQVPLFALLQRRLTDEEVQTIADVLTAQAAGSSDVSAIDARVLLTKTLGELPSESELERVRDHLALHGATLS